MEKAFIITARTPSSRLPSKIIKKIYKNKRTIDIIIERAKKINLPIILATTRKKDDDFLCSYVKQKHQISIFRGDLSKIKRWYHCFKKYKIKYACFVEGDDPLFNYNFYKNEINKKIKHEVITYPKNIITGIFFYIISYNGILKMKNFVEKYKYEDTEIIDPFVEKAKLKKKTIFIKKIFKNKNIRLTLDYPEDYLLIKKLTKKFGYLIESEKIVNFLIKNKKLSKINFFREKDYRNNQSTIIKKWGVQ